MTEQLANFSYSFLASSIGPGATTLSVISASPFSTIGNFRLLVDSELMLVTAVSGTTFTVTRGIEGTTATSHSAGVQVSQQLTAGGLAAFVNQAAQIPYTHVQLTAPLSIGNAGTTVVVFNTVDYDPLSQYSAGTFTFQKAGWWRLTCFLHWSSSSSGFRIAEYKINGTTFIGDVASQAVSDMRNNPCIDYFFNLGDTVAMTVFQTSGGPLSIAYGLMSVAWLNVA